MKRAGDRFPRAPRDFGTHAQAREAKRTAPAALVQRHAGHHRSATSISRLRQAEGVVGIRGTIALHAFQYLVVLT
ncbi:MAG: hypothetical protein ABSG91_15935 [Syntrophobacteraceae bacterium]